MPETKPEQEDQKPRRTLAGVFNYIKGKWVPAWALLLTPFLAVLWYLHRAVKDEVNWKAAFAAVAVFEVVLFPAEWYSVSRGHWVYNEARILGPKILGVPIEEPLLYYLFSPLIIITVMHAIRKFLEAREAP